MIEQIVMTPRPVSGFLLLEILAAMIITAVLTIALIATVSPRAIQHDRADTPVPVW